MLRSLYLMSIYYLFGFLSHQDIRAYTESFSITWSEAKQNFLEQKKVFGHEKRAQSSQDFLYTNMAAMTYS